MKNKFLLGAVAGLGSLALAVPLLSTMSFAASSATTTVPSTTSSAATQEKAQANDPKDQPVDPSAVKLTQATAEQTALATHPGKISETTTLRNWDGTSSFKVEITGTDGKEYDTIVDGNTGTVSQSWEDGKGGPHHGVKDAPEANDTPDTNTTGADSSTELPGTENPAN